MIQKYVDRFIGKKNEIFSEFTKQIDSYSDFVKIVISAVADEDDYGDPDPKRIHEIDDGDYQGTLLFVVAANGYQPSDYYYVKVSYGSCSGCDTLEAINEGGSYDDEGNRLPPSSRQKEAYWTLCLHIVQGLKKLEE